MNTKQQTPEDEFDGLCLRCLTRAKAKRKDIKKSVFGYQRLQEYVSKCPECNTDTVIHKNMDVERISE